MIKGITCFSNYNTVTASSDATVINQILAAGNSCIPVIRQGAVKGYFAYASVSRAMNLVTQKYVGGQLTVSTVSRFSLVQSLAGVIKDIGDTLTIGATIGGIAAADNIRGAAFYDGADDTPASVLTYAGQTSLPTQVYMEVSVSKEAEGVFRYIIRADSAEVLNTTAATLKEKAAIGIDANWKNPAISATKYIQLSNIYWAFNSDGEQEFIGSCTVAAATVNAVPNTVPSLQGKVNISLTSGSVSPNALNTQVVTSPADQGLPTGSKIVATSYRAFGTSSAAGQKATLRTSIVGSDGQVKGSSFVETSSISPYVHTDSVCIETTNEDFVNLKFVANNK